jgi:hypothetical protein
MLNDNNPIETDVRRERRRRRLGANAVCLLCGEAELSTLVGVSKKFLEDHHIAGRANDSEMVIPLCLNCHRKVTEDAAQCGLDLSQPRSFLNRLLAILLGLAVLFTRLGAALAHWAQELSNLIASLDQDCPDWIEAGRAA